MFLGIETSAVPEKQCVIMGRMGDKSVKKRISRGVLLLFLVCFIVTGFTTGNPFNLIDAIVIRPIMNILFVIGRMFALELVRNGF